jgi:hypothetical protein
MKKFIFNLPDEKYYSNSKILFNFLYFPKIYLF